MPWTIERLRLAIVALAAVLLLAIVGSFFYGRWRLRHIAQDLPAHLGLQIQQSTQGFVLSQSNDEGRTIFTLHAARAIAFKSGGRVLLHDVEIDVFNQDGKADTIAGKDFQYDRNSQIVISQGEAHIVLHPPQSTAVGGPNKNATQVVRVTTHGLVFSQKTGVATCSGEVDFQVADSSGQAVGAEYDSKQGHLLLDSQVVLTTAMQNHPAVVHASQAIYDKNVNQVHLQQPRYSSGNDHGSAGAAIVVLRADGSAERLDAQDAVQLASAGGTAVRAATMHAQLNENSRPQQVHFGGGVQFTQNQPKQQGAGSAREALVEFDAQGHARKAIFDREVQFHQRMDAGQNHLQRTLNADHLVLHLLAGKTGQSQLQVADATGHAIFTSRSASPGHPPQQTQMAAQNLQASFLPGNLIQHIEGAEQTRLRTVAANGDIDTSAGDTLSIDFAPSAAPNASTKPKAQMAGASSGATNALAAQSIRTAVQTGHVVLQQTTPAKKGAASNGDMSVPQIATATATRAQYEAANDTLVLTGQPVFRDAQLEMTASRMEMRRTTGEMTASGAVQTTLRSNQTSPAANAGGLMSGSQPTHIIAQQATLMHATQRAVFTGQARLWQGGNTVEAPVIEVSQKRQALLAYGSASCMQCVHSTFLGQAGSQQAPLGQTAKSSPANPTSADSTPGTARATSKISGPSMFRVVSQRLEYSDAERKASFLNHVEVISSSGQMFADHAEIFLSPATGLHAEKQKNFSSGRNNSPQSSVERIVAAGHVRLVQPGRRATGARLVYTASDGHFVLTGDGKYLPRVVDADRGTVTGQVLTFASQEQAIIVRGTSAHATTTETRVKKK